MMLSDVCLSDLCRVHPVSGRRVRPAGRLDGAYWLIRPGSAGLAQGCRCTFPLHAWAETYRGGRPPTACLMKWWQTIPPHTCSIAMVSSS